MINPTCNPIEHAVYSLQHAILLSGFRSERKEPDTQQALEKDLDMHILAAPISRETRAILEVHGAIVESRRREDLIIFLPGTEPQKLLKQHDAPVNPRNVDAEVYELRFLDGVVLMEIYIAPMDMSVVSLIEGE